LILLSILVALLIFYDFFNLKDPESQACQESSEKQANRNSEKNQKKIL